MARITSSDGAFRARNKLLDGIIYETGPLLENKHCERHQKNMCKVRETREGERMMDRERQRERVDDRRELYYRKGVQRYE